MKKIYSEIVMQWDNDSQSYVQEKATYTLYDGPISHCKGEAPSSSGTTVQKSEPWDQQIPYLLAGFDKAKDLYMDSSPPSLYPGSTVVPFSPEKETALQLQAMRAITGSPLQPVANAQALATMGGAYLPSNNPFNTTLNEEFDSPENSARFQGAIDAAGRKIRPMVESQFNSSGMLNSGLADVAKTQAISDAFASQYMQDKSLTAQDRAMRGQNFSNERENVMRSILASPQLMANDYADFQQLGQVGDMRDALAQEQVQEAANRYAYGQTADQDQLSKYLAAISGSYGGTTTGTSNTGGQLNRSMGGGLLGGSLAGYSILSGIKGANPLYGAVGGGLLGAFGL